MESFWLQIKEATLRQGDWIPTCDVPICSWMSNTEDTADLDVEIQTKDLIVLTQSCDLENKKARFVALCPIYSLQDFEKTNPRFMQKGQWNEVRRGRVEGLHLLASPQNPSDSRSALVVDFREIHSLPIEYLMAHVTELDDRWRLKSPFLEHFSQNFARFFMRVGLPSAVPEFK
jgi:hypothetical protein